MSRRDFLKLAAAAGLLAGCRPHQDPTPTPTETTRRPEVMRMYPDVLSKVVRARHAGVWDGEELVPNAIQQMLDASITELTGLNDATTAWAALFDPSEHIAIKVNTIITSDFWTHVPLVMAVTERLQEVGVRPEQITIFDRDAYELKHAGYTINEDGPGVRCCGTGGDYTEGWTLMDSDILLSDILLSCDALVNMPILKHHSHSGITFAMKNHFGTFNRPASFHRPRTGPAIVELNALPPIKDRTRLTIGDTLAICPISRHGWYEAVNGDSILMSFDPVAHDAVGLQMLCEVMAAEGHDAAGAESIATSWLTSAAEVGLGASDPDNMDLVEVSLG
jgi:hypothetical protein